MVNLKLDIQISPLQRSHLSEIKRLNQICLPLLYKPAVYESLFSSTVFENSAALEKPLLNESWPRDIASETACASWIAVDKLENTIVGCILLRPQRSIPFQSKYNRSTSNDDLTHSERQIVEIDDDHGFYLISIAVLPQYRKRGVASSLLLHAIQSLSENSQASWLRLHVQTSNEQAMRIYHRANFKVESQIEDYYSHLNLNPSSAYALKYDFGRNAALSSNSLIRSVNVTNKVPSFSSSDQQAVV